MTDTHRESILDAIQRDLDEASYYLTTGAFYVDYAGEERYAATMKAETYRKLSEAIIAIGGDGQQADDIANDWEAVANEYATVTET